MSSAWLDLCDVLFRSVMLEDQTSHFPVACSLRAFEWTMERTRKASMTSLSVSVSSFSNLASHAALA